MDTLVQNTLNSVGYIRCGEILKSKNGFQNPYILRCIQCKEMYLLLESFIFHLNDSCREVHAGEKYAKQTVNYSSEEVDVINEPNVEREGAPVKLEHSNVQMEDPLIVLKNENEIDRSSIKIETNNYEVAANNDTIEVFDGVKPSNKCEGDDDSAEDVEDIDTLSESQNESESQASDTDDLKVIQIPANPKGVPSSFVSSFMKSEENLTVLIAAFKDQPQLWNKTSPHFGSKLKRREHMIKIAEDLKMNHNIDINGSQVSALVVHLYRKYHEYLHRAQDKDENRKQQYGKPWYLAQLSFIEPHLENYSLEFLDANHPVLAPEQILEIFEIYQNLPHLWNSNIIENHCKNKRHESIVKMLKQLESNMNITINENTLEQYLRTIHINFSREKRRILNFKKSNKLDDNEQASNKYYEQLKFLYDHVPPLRCSVCGADSISPLHFKMHTSSHDGSMPFTCSQCNRTFKRVNVYTSHAKRHFEDLNYICKECDKKFVNYTNLRLHMRIHTGDKPYCCEICGDSFRFLQTLSDHRRRHEKRYLHTCKICSQGFYSKMRHDDHMNSHNNIRSHVCEICSKAFITKRALKQHKLVHDDVRNYACRLCGKTFKHKTGVNQHMKTHDIATTEERTVA